MKVAIGPMLFLWQKQQLADFYHDVANSNADIVYLGETVCAKRRLSRTEDYLAWAHQLIEAGKQVVLSTLTLVESPLQVRELTGLCDSQSLLFEANDMAAIHILSERKRPFVIGPAINVYNGYALAKLAQLGAIRWVMPVELSRDWLAAIKQEYQAVCDLPMEFEVFSYGYLPLAVSARCFTARHYDVAKDSCELVCQQHPEGLKANSQDGTELFTLNGIQTMSGQIYNLCQDTNSLVEVASIARISAHQTQDLQWINGFMSETTTMRPEGHINGFWHRIAGMHVAS